DGGTLKGRVTLSGRIPKARSFHLINAPNIEFCSRISDGSSVNTARIKIVIWFIIIGGDLFRSLIALLAVPVPL
ncbi:MAG: hypothetical protein ACE1Z6_10670, partial [Candidatus Methylomirabilales bacterium]